jgi:transcriptional regulator with XRE-family HTH domain
MKNKFFEQLCSLRTENNMSRSELAKKLGVSTRLISYWENGQRECDFDMLIKISTIFNVSIDYLLGKAEY